VITVWGGLVPKKSTLEHLDTEDARDVVFQKCSAALRAELLPLVATYHESDHCLTCIYWQVLRALAVAACFFADKVMEHPDEQLPAFILDVRKALRRKAAKESSCARGETVH